MSNINLCDCEEHWMKIKNKYGSLYKLSLKGRLYSYKNKKYIGYVNKYNGYIDVSGFFSCKIHRLVYRYFYQINIEDYDINYNEIDNIDTIRNHNYICNLRIGSRKDNQNNLKTKKKYI